MTIFIVSHRCGDEILNFDITFNLHAVMTQISSTIIIIFSVRMQVFKVRIFISIDLERDFVIADIASFSDRSHRIKKK